MASISFKDFELNQTNITGKRHPSVMVDAIKFRYKVDPETKQRTEEKDGTAVDIYTKYGKLQTVKLPEGAVSDETFQQIQQALKERKIVKVNFGSTASTLRGRCYAMLSNGQLIQGVSATATELNLVSIEEPEFDDIDDLDIEL